MSSPLNDITNGQNHNVFSFEGWLKNAHQVEGYNPNQIVQCLRELADKHIILNPLQHVQALEREMTVSIFLHNMKNARSCVDKIKEIALKKPTYEVVVATAFIASANFHFISARESKNKGEQENLLQTVELEIRVAHSSLTQVQDSGGFLEGKYYLLLANVLASKNRLDQAVGFWRRAEIVFNQHGLKYLNYEAFVSRFESFKPSLGLEKLVELGQEFTDFPSVKYRFLLAKLEICKSKESSGVWRKAYFDTAEEAYLVALHCLRPIGGISDTEFSRIWQIHKSLPGVREAAKRGGNG